MNHINLKKVTLIVSVWALAANFVSAEDKVASIETPTVKAISTKASLTKGLAMPISEISTLLTKFDSDKSGSLSKTEVVDSKNKLLTKNFKSIDKNEDAAISKDELKSYFML